MGAVEGKKVRGGLFERGAAAVASKFFRENEFGSATQAHERPRPLGKSRLEGFGYPRPRFLADHGPSGDYQGLRVEKLSDLLDVPRLAVAQDHRVSLFHVLRNGRSFRHLEAYHRFFPGAFPEQNRGCGLGGVLADLRPAVGAEGFSELGEKKPGVVVYLRRGSDRGAGIHDAVSVLDGYRSGKTFYVVHRGTLDLFDELPRVGRKAVYVPPEPFLVDGVEHQGGFPRAAYAGHHGEPVSGDGDVHALQVVFRRLSYFYVSVASGHLGSAVWGVFPAPARTGIEVCWLIRYPAGRGELKIRVPSLVTLHDLPSLITRASRFSRGAGVSAETAKFPGLFSAAACRNHACSGAYG